MCSFYKLTNRLIIGPSLISGSAFSTGALTTDSAALACDCAGNTNDTVMCRLRNVNKVYPCMDAGFAHIMESHGIKERNFPGLESHGKVMEFHQQVMEFFNRRIIIFV